jgi:hypothetical protein
MYEEDSWEAPTQQPAAETEDGQGAVVSPVVPPANAEIQVPARAPEKQKGGFRFFKKDAAAASKNTKDEGDALAGGNALAGEDVKPPRKKGIPKWQYGVLGGFVVVAGGGFAVITLMSPRAGTAAMAPMQAQAQTQASQSPSAHLATTPKAVVHGGQGGDPAAAKLSASAALADTTPVGGFSTLNNLPGSTVPQGMAPQKPPVPTANPAASMTAFAATHSVVGTPTPQTLVNAQQAQAAPGPATVTGAHNGQLAQLRREVSSTQGQIARLKRELQTEKQMAKSPAAQPKVITRTIIRYVHVPVAATSHARPVHSHPSSPASQGFTPSSSQHVSGWSVVGGNGHVAILAGPGGQVHSVHVGDALPGGVIVQSIALGRVTTSDGVIR